MSKQDEFVFDWLDGERGWRKTSHLDGYTMAMPSEFIERWKKAYVVLSELEDELFAVAKVQNDAKDAEIDRLCAIAHDWTQPLSTVVAYFECVRCGAYKEDEVSE